MQKHGLCVIYDSLWDGLWDGLYGLYIIYKGSLALNAQIIRFHIHLQRFSCPIHQSVNHATARTHSEKRPQERRPLAATLLSINSDVITLGVFFGEVLRHGHWLNAGRCSPEILEIQTRFPKRLSQNIYGLHKTSLSPKVFSFSGRRKMVLRVCWQLRTLSPRDPL